jgi:predicted phage gp36 major capsid-like protein
LTSGNDLSYTCAAKQYIAKYVISYTERAVVKKAKSEDPSRQRTSIVGVPSKTVSWNVESASASAPPVADPVHRRGESRPVWTRVSVVFAPVYRLSNTSAVAISASW